MGGININVLPLELRATLGVYTFLRNIVLLSTVSTSVPSSTPSNQLFRSPSTSSAMTVTLNITQVACTGAPLVKKDSTQQPRRPQPPKRTASMARIPPDLYRPILAHLFNGEQASPKEMFKLLTVSKAFSREVLRILYSSLDLIADKPKPSFADPALYGLVRKVKITVTPRLRGRELEHQKACEELVPQFDRLEHLEIRGRGWNSVMLDKWTGLSLRSLTIDSNLTPSVAHFIASQSELEELDLMGGTATSAPTEDVISQLPESLPRLLKLSVPNVTCPAISLRAPSLQHVKLVLDLMDTAADITETLSALPNTVESVFINTGRRDLIDCLRSLPKSVRCLSTAFVQTDEDQARLLACLAELPLLDTLILSIHHTKPLTNTTTPTSVTSPTTSFVNPFSMTPSSPTSPTPLSQTEVSPFSSPKASSHALPYHEEAEDEQDPFITALANARPTLASIILDDQTHRQQSVAWAPSRRQSWARTSLMPVESEGTGILGRRKSVATLDALLWMTL